MGRYTKYGLGLLAVVGIGVTTWVAYEASQLRDPEEDQESRV